MSARNADPHKVLDADVFSDDGGLYCLGWYLSWSKGDKTACLDADFTAEELHAIANFMEQEKCDGNHAEPPCADNECWLK